MLVFTIPQVCHSEEHSDEESLIMFFNHRGNETLRFAHTAPVVRCRGSDIISYIWETAA